MPRLYDVMKENGIFSIYDALAARKLFDRFVPRIEEETKKHKLMVFSKE
jgi:hypothetical protein